MTEYVPAAKEELWRVATPAALSMAVPSGVAPFENVTVPVGTAPATVATDALNVTVWPTVDEAGVADNETAAVEGADLTTSDAAPEVPEEYFVSPP